MAHLAKREFLDLRVDEVSLVDDPANEKRFVIMKRRTTTGASEMEDTQQTSTNEKSNVVAQMDALIEKAKQAKKAADAGPTESSQEGEGKDEKPPKVEVEVEGEKKSVKAQLKAAKKAMKAEKRAKKAADLKKACKEMLEKAGVKGAELEKAMEGARALFEVNPGGAARPPLEKTKKGKDMSDTADKNVNDAREELISKVLDGVVDSINKAKVFTPKRQAALKAVREQLSSLLDELEQLPDGGRDKIPGSQETDEQGKLKPLPAGQGRVPESGLQDIKEASPVMKALEELKGVTKSLGERLDGIEKTRQPPKGADSEVTDTPTNKGKDKSFWGGVL